MSNKISVVVPAYNIAEYLPRCLGSILNQTYSNLEVIVVSDGSTDRTNQIIQTYANKDSRILPIFKENTGVSDTRRKGIEIATGKWIGFVDGDDYIEPDMYERLLNNAIKYKADISHCGYQMVFPSRVDYYYNTGRFVQQDNLTGLKDLLGGSFIEPGLWNKLFRKTLFHSLLHLDGFDFSIRINEDLLMNYYLFKESQNSVYEDFCPYHYIVRKNSAATSGVNENQLRDPLLVRKMIRNDCDNSELIHILDGSIERILIANATMGCSHDKNLIKPYMMLARKELRKGLSHYLKGNFSSKQKLSAIWVSVWPASYRWIHSIYSKVKGTDKKYEVS